MTRLMHSLRGKINIPTDNLEIAEGLKVCVNFPEGDHDSFLNGQIGFVRERRVNLCAVEFESFVDCTADGFAKGHSAFVPAVYLEKA